MEIHDVYVFKADYAHFECGSVAHPEGLLATRQICPAANAARAKGAKRNGSC